jgi:hypothetical protein
MEDAIRAEMWHSHPFRMLMAGFGYDSSRAERPRQFAATLFAQKCLYAT